MSQESPSRPRSDGISSANSETGTSRPRTGCSSGSGRRGSVGPPRSVGDTHESRPATSGRTPSATLPGTPGRTNRYSPVTRVTPTISPFGLKRTHEALALMGWSSTSSPICRWASRPRPTDPTSRPRSATSGRSTSMTTPDDEPRDESSPGPGTRAGSARPVAQPETATSRASRRAWSTSRMGRQCLVRAAQQRTTARSGLVDSARRSAPTVEEAEKPARITPSGLFNRWSAMQDGFRTFGAASLCLTP